MSDMENKRLILCCDGTWMDSDDGFTKPTLIPYVPTGTLQIPSNVTRISRALNRVDRNGKPQIIYYHSGVGTGFSIVDSISGGLTGRGISENIREVYSFIATNYSPGDEIVLIGFSRGAFTVRSVASMIRDIGLLNRAGMNVFYAIFKDQENFRNPKYNDIFPGIPFSRKPHGPDAAIEYKRRLEKNNLTRVYNPDGTKIDVYAVAVWDTVGALGIPNLAILSRMGVPSSTKEYKFYDTSLSGIIRHAFQALALDEHRAPFSPAVWERKHMDKTTTDLRQVWFPGAHSNVGGGYPDQEIANISLAWMMDQLASIGIAFQESFIEQIYTETVNYFENPPPQPKTFSDLFKRTDSQWAVTPIYEKYKPVRPWGLGKIIEAKTGIYDLTGKTIRTPGLYKRADPDTGVSTGVPMVHTNERIHRCVRIRLELDGLGLDDNGLYKCTALYKSGPWRLRERRIRVRDPIPWDASWGPKTPPSTTRPDDLRWVWEYDGSEDDVPRERIMVEENLGPYQRQLLRLSAERQPKRNNKRRRRRKPSSRSHSSQPGTPPIVLERPLRRHKEETVIVSNHPITDGEIILEEVHEHELPRRDRYRQRDDEIVVEEEIEPPPRRERDGSRYRASVVYVERKRDRSRYGGDAPPERFRQGDDEIVVEEEYEPPRRERASSKYR